MMKITVIEDDLPIALMYEMKLRQTGYDVSVAHNGEDGLELAENFKPNLILLDLKMPQMNGEEMLRKLREMDWGADIKVIILTNSSKAEAPSSLRFLNVERYVVKAHHTPGQVIDIVREVLGEPKL